MVAAVVLRADQQLGYGHGDVVIRDSKQLTVRQRERLGGIILESSVAVAVCTVSVAEINRYGINWANTRAFAQLVAALDADEYVVDGRWELPQLGVRTGRVRCQIGADNSVPAALSAGVVAKLWRDDLMRELAARHPPYGWERNTGHGTAGHLEALRAFGRTDQHRKLFVDTALDGRRASARRALRQRRREREHAATT